MTLLLVDGTNAMMRRAMVMRDMPAEDIAEEVAHRMTRAAKELRCSHVIVAFDDATNWRYDAYPQYKADREGGVDTKPYARVAWKFWRSLGFNCVLSRNYEADDVIATLAFRACRSRRVFTLSSDNDLLQLLMWENIRVMQYNHDRNGPWLVERTAEYVQEKYGVRPTALPSYLALVGGKNGVPGVPKIGAKTAARILSAPNLHVLTPPSQYTQAMLDAIPEEHHDWATTAQRLHTLQLHAPIGPIVPADCVVPELVRV